MALDGITLHFVKTELEQTVLGARVEKVHQPSKAEIVLLLRTRGGAFRLFLSAESASARVHLTQFPTENPQNPPMLCMLFRKHLTGATLVGIRQAGLDRILFFDFDAANEIGDKVKLTLCIEITGQHSNIILIDGNGKILDAVKRVDETKSSVREVLPNCTYVLPPRQDKINLLSASVEQAAARVKLQKNQQLAKAFMQSVEGISPIVSRELAHLAAGDCTCAVEVVPKQQIAAALENVKRCLQTDAPQYCTVYNEEDKPFDFSFLDITQYGAFYKKTYADSFCALLDAFYFERDRVLRAKRKAGDLYKALHTLQERTVRKISNQQAELSACADKEQLRVFAELINANQYALTKGSPVYVVPNYYANNETVRIPVNPALSPAQNAQKFYKAYKKAHTAEKMLAGLIEKGEQEILYFDSVLDTLSRAETESELTLIRQELIDGGYLKRKKGGKLRLPKELPPYQFKTSEGFTVLVGRNNTQNDKLTLKTAKNYDMWLHTQNFAGSHTVILSENREITDKAIVEAAEIAAFFSSAKEAQKVPVDYTLIKNIKKPVGAKPGKVIYHVYNTVFVTPRNPEETKT
ncbi:MAG: NFACT family protein [Ruminococcus sp.]|nr:NFACT family protein [Ruminococcus sp.]